MSIGELGGVALLEAGNEGSRWMIGLFAASTTAKFMPHWTCPSQPLVLVTKRSLVEKEILRLVMVRSKARTPKGVFKLVYSCTVVCYIFNPRRRV